MPRTIKLLALALIAVLLSAPAALAADIKLAVVDVEYVILTSKKGKKAKKKLKKLFEKKQKVLDKKQTELLELKKVIENPSDLDTAERRKKAVMEYQQGVLALQEEFVKNQQDLAKKEVELMKPILKSLEGVMAKVAKDKDLDLIMNRNQNGVIFAKPAFDLTDEVLGLLDKAK